MKKRSIVLVALCYLFVLTSVLSGCTAKSGDGNPELVRTSNLVKTDLYEIPGKGVGYRYEPTLELSTMAVRGPHIQFIEGEDLANNVWTRAYEEYLGIKLAITTECTSYTDFDTKVNLAMTTGQLPDLLPIYTTLFFRIADQDKLADLRDSYDKYASDDVIRGMEGYGGIAMKSCTINGKLVGIAGGGKPGAGFMWIRSDWLEELDVEWPTNINETYELMKLFKDKNPGGADYPVAMSIDSGLSGMAGFANAYGAYHTVWVDDGNGGITFGNIQDEWLPVLEKLNGMYKDEYIAEDFPSLSNTDIRRDYSSQACGIVFGNSSSADGLINTAVEFNKNARWKHGMIMDEEGNPAKIQAGTRIGGYAAVNKTCAYPEALLMLINIWPVLILGPSQEYHDFEKDGTHYDSFFYPLFSTVGPEDYGMECLTKIKEAIETGDDSKLNGEQKGYLKRMTPWLENQNPAGWRMWAIFGPEGSNLTQKEVEDNKAIYPDRFWGVEPKTWKEKGPELSKKVTDYFVMIISNHFPSVEEGFNEWKNHYLNQGGADIIKELNEWWNIEGRAGFEECYGDYI